MKTQKKIFVTGVTGFVGSNLVRRLIKENYDVHISYRKTSDVWRIKDIFSRLHSHEVDLLDKKKLDEVIKIIQPTIIFHLANVGIYGGVESNVEQVTNGNFIATVNLISACDKIEYECFVNTGSSSEYGLKNSPMREDDKCTPQSVYAITKLAATLYAQMQGKVHNKRIVTLRLFSPYGFFDEKQRLISYVITKALQKKPLYLYKPDSVRDYIFIDDVVDAYLACVKNSQKIAGEVINIGSGKQELISKVAGMILDNINKENHILWNSKVKPRYESPVWKADIKKSKILLDWYPKTSLDEGINKTIQWFMEHKDLYKE